MRVVCCFCRVLTYLRTCGLLNDIDCESCSIEACRCDSMSGNMYHIWIRPASFYRTLYAFEVKHFSNKPTRLMSSMHTGVLLYGEFEKCYAQTVCPSVLLLFPAMCIYFQKRCLCLQQCSFISKNTASISSSAVFCWTFWMKVLVSSRSRFIQSCHHWSRPDCFLFSEPGFVNWAELWLRTKNILLGSRIQLLLENCLHFSIFDHL